MRLVVLVLLLSACVFNRQEKPPVAPVFIQSITPINSARINALWELAKYCAGAARDTTKTLEEIHWFRRSRISLPFRRGLLLGQWVPPDTIYVTEGFDRDPWVLAHEMLHHALNGPPLPKDTMDLWTFDPHPPGQFAACGLAVHPSDVPMFDP